MRAPLAAGLATLFILACVPAADASVHGVPWTATGFGVGTDGNVVAVTVNFLGQICFAPFYHVRVATLAGSVLVDNTFAGYEIQNQSPLTDAYEQSFGQYGGSTDPAVDFAWNGASVNLIYPGTSYVNQGMAGHYGGYYFEMTTVLQHFVFGC
jgi:hypothetical protein